MAMPKWATTDRRSHLVKLFLDSGGFCIYGHKDCLIPAHHYEVYIEYLISDWKSEDREQARLDWIEERKAIHSLGEPRYREGRFGTISREVFFGNQPAYYLEALGISGLTLTPFAKIKLGSSYMRLYVDLGDSLRGASKNQRRKAIRYGKVLPKVIDERIAETIREAVRHYLK